MLSSSCHDSGAGLAFPSSFQLHTLAIGNGAAVTTAVSAGSAYSSPSTQTSHVFSLWSCVHLVPPSQS